MVEKKRKYLLFNKDDGRPDHEKPCAFLGSPEGCRNGSNCRFSHSITSMEASVEQAKPKEATTAVVNTTHIKPANQGMKRHIDTSPTDKTEAAIFTQTYSQPPVHSHQQQQSTKNNFKANTMISHQNNSTNGHHNSSNESIFSTANPSSQSAKKPKIDYRHKLKKKDIATGKIFLPNGPKISNKHQQVMEEKEDDDDDDDAKFLFQAVDSVIHGNSVQSPPSIVHTNNAIKAFQEPTHNSAAIQPPHHHAGLIAPNTIHQMNFSNPNASNLIPSSHTFPAAHITGINPHTTVQVIPQPTSIVHAHHPPAQSNSLSKGLTWNDLLQLTKAHTRYRSEYSFDEDKSWVTSRAPGPWCANLNLPPIIAIDCEMCETEDPLTGEKDGAALVRVSAVNGLNPQEVLIDSLVKPAWPISDLREHIHGITASQLENVTFTLRHAQAALMKICASTTILVGHGLSNDLKALKFSHRNNVDTGFIFPLKNDPDNCPSLRDVTYAVSKVVMPQTHDSVEDARRALAAANYVLELGVVKAISRYQINDQTSLNLETANSTSSSSLFVYRLPSECTEDHLYKLFCDQSFVIPTEVQKIIRCDESLNNISPPPPGLSSIATGKTYVFFHTSSHADLAFRTLQGMNKPDKSGRPQKRIYLKGGGYICIRMCFKNN